MFEIKMYEWRMFYRNTTVYPRYTLFAPTKLDAELLAFEMFNQPFDADLVRPTEVADV